MTSTSIILQHLYIYLCIYINNLIISVYLFHKSYLSNIYHIFQESLNPVLSNGIVIVSTIPGPQYIHSAAKIESI